MTHYHKTRKEFFFDIVQKKFKNSFFFKIVNEKFNKKLIFLVYRGFAAPKAPQSYFDPFFKNTIAPTEFRKVAAP